MEEWEVTTNRYRVSFSVGENLQKVVQLDAAELLQILKDDAVKVLHSICRQIWKTQQRPQDWKRSVFIPIPKNFSSVAQSCPTLCDAMNRSTPGLPVHHHLPEFTQTHIKKGNAK